MSDYLEIAKRVMRERECAEAQDLNDSLEVVLKGQAVELWSDRAGKLFLVADEEDAAVAMERYGAARGEVYSAAEIRRITRIADPADVAAINNWKRTFNAVIRDVEGAEGYIRTLISETGSNDGA